MLLRLVTCCLLAGLFFPCTSLAWTRAHVREAHARVELAEVGPALVTLELLVDVQGGWLERLELPLLDDDLQLAAEAPAQVTLESGEQLEARASAKAAVVTLKFERRDGLRRGLHRLRVRYATDLLAQAGRGEANDLRVAWTLPGWESGLLAADIVFSSKQPLRAVADPELAQETSSQRESGLHTVRFVRVHVPRASQWRVAVDVPRAVLGARAAAGGQAAKSPRSWLTGCAVAAFCLAVVLVARVSVRRRLARQRLVARGPFGRSASWWLLSLVAVLAALSWRVWPAAACLILLALPALAFEARLAPSAPLALGSFQPVQRADLSRLRWARVREWIGVPGADLTTLLGGGSALGLVAFVLMHPDSLQGNEPWGLALLSSLPSFVTSSRLRLPRSLAAQVAILARAAERTRMVSCALGLVWYVAGHEREQPRLRLFPRARYAGLLRLEVLVDARRAADPLLLSVLVEADSPAERWTRALWPGCMQERSPGGPRLALLRPIDDLSDSIEQLLEHYTRESQRAFAEPNTESRAA